MSDFELLMHELGRLPDVVPRSKVLDVLRMFSGCRLRIDGRVLRRLEHDRTAAGLLGAGLDRGEARKALQERLGLSEWAARRLLNRALRARGPRRDS